MNFYWFVSFMHPLASQWRRTLVGKLRPSVAHVNWGIMMGVVFFLGNVSLRWKPPSLSDLFLSSSKRKCWSNTTGGRDIHDSLIINYSSLAFIWIKLMIKMIQFHFRISNIVPLLWGKCVGFKMYINNAYQKKTPWQKTMRTAIL